MLQRFQDALEVKIAEAPDIWSFRTRDNPKHGAFALAEVFSNGRHDGEIEANPELDARKSPYTAWRKYTICRPHVGCLVMAELMFWRPDREMDPAQRVGEDAYAAYLFDGADWKPWQRPWDVDMSHSGDGLEISILDQRRQILVKVNRMEYRHSVIAFRHCLEYCSGHRSLADVMAIICEEDFRSYARDRAKILRKMRPLIRSLKGSVGSKAVHELDELFGELCGDILPF